jgi:NAD(P)H-flavin reductase
MVAGGTGLAPFLALLDAATVTATATAAAPARSVHLFVGARRRTGLYRLAALRRLADQHPWLTVVEAVSDEPAYPGARGPVGQVAAGHRDWSGHQVLLSGPPAMIRSTVGALHARGVPLAQIHYDPYDPLPADHPRG